MNTQFEIIRGTIILVVMIAVFVWIMVRWLKRSSDDPGWLITKWVITAIVVPVAFIGVPMAGPFGIPIVAACGGILAALWTRNICAFFARPLADIFDAGEEPAEPRPAYSAAHTKRKFGRYHEAVAEVRRQLEPFPDDMEGMMLLAELQAENLNDLPGASLTLQRICNTPEREPRQVASALHRLADWHLKLTQDREAARRALEQIVDRFPGTELALRASQRIAHLGSTDLLLASHDRVAVRVPHGIDNLGLLADTAHLRPAESDPSEEAGALVKHLEQYPFDTEAREKLALIYAEHYQRLDLALTELEQLIAMPNQPSKPVVHWLNLIAGLHIKQAGDVEAARLALLRIIDRYPKAAAAENARRRIETLRLEARSKIKSQAVKPGSYEENIGLNPERFRGKGRRSA